MVVPRAAYIAERAIDAVARHLNLDQVEVRRRNFIQRADFPYRPYNGPAVMYDSGNYEGCLAKAMEAFNYEARSSERDRIAGQRPLSRHRSGRLYPYVRHGAVAPPLADGI